MQKPELYVIFTGERKNIPDTMSLSKEFFGGAEIAINAEVKILYQENEKDIMMTLFDDEQILKAYAKDIEDSRERETERKTEKD